MELNIDIVVADLKDGKAPRTQQALDKLNGILKKYAESGQRDFSITQIGRISSAEGGLGYEALRATRNKHYRDLIEVWAQKCKTNTKKPLSPNSRSNSIPKDNMLLERIPDPAVRALFGQIIAERNRYRNEASLLKQHANVIIDKRPVRQFDIAAEQSIEVLPALVGLLNESEKKALAYAISDECMKSQNWQPTQAGQVKEMEYGTEIFPRGFLTGLRKILGAVEK